MDKMYSHDLAKILLENENMPVATHALNHTNHDGCVRVGVLKAYNGEFIIIGDMSKKNINKPNYYITSMITDDIPDEWPSYGY